MRLNLKMDIARALVIVLFMAIISNGHVVVKGAEYTYQTHILEIDGYNSHPDNKWFVTGVEWLWRNDYPTNYLRTNTNSLLVYIRNMTFEDLPSDVREIVSCNLTVEYANDAGYGFDSHYTLGAGWTYISKCNSTAGYWTNSSWSIPALNTREEINNFEYSIYHTQASVQGNLVDYVFLTVNSSIIDVFPVRLLGLSLMFTGFGFLFIPIAIIAKVRPKPDQIVVLLFISLIGLFLVVASAVMEIP